MKKQTIDIVSSEYAPYICGGLGTHVVNVISTLSNYSDIQLFVPRRSKYAVTPINVQLNQVGCKNGLGHIDYWMTFCKNMITLLSKFAPIVN